MATSGSQQNSVNNCRIMDQSSSAPSSSTAGTVSALRHLQNLQQLQHLHQLHHLHSIHKRHPQTTASSSPSSSPLTQSASSQCMDQTWSWHPHVYRPKKLTSHLIVDILFPDNSNNNNKTSVDVDDDGEDREKKCRQSVSTSVLPSPSASSSSSSCCNPSPVDPLTSPDQTTAGPVCNLDLKSVEAGKQESGGSADVPVTKYEGTTEAPSHQVRRLRHSRVILV